ncbi:TPM domain-containing protein [Mycetocola spongiae]|uniref:TPM domain-containing protein n=1 Tax=Mycetocola spongiae TaxID=2859226 RepID=UPI001CF2CBBE|nr:TPM domain-containing protein [Mycetocola spongiae]UCR90177.1 TPM domain-containing protein [Mycetocola spongiae]
MVFGATGTASAMVPAESPVQLGEGRIIDSSDVLTNGQIKDVTTRITELSDRSGVDLWVVYVDTFDNPTDRADWANTVAEKNGLGSNQYLLAIATESRNYYLSGDSAGPVSDSALSQIEEKLILPALRQNDFPGAALAAVTGLQEAVSGKTPGAPSGGGAGVLILLLVIAVIAILIFFWLRRRRARSGTAREGGGAASRPIAELEREAGSALIAADDAVKTAEQELGFALAQYGEDSTTEFGATLVRARATLAEAFKLKQKLSDDIPDTEAEVREWNTRIRQLCGSAIAELTEQTESFGALRAMEADAPALIESIRSERERASAAVEAARVTLAALTTRFSPAALAPVADNIEQAGERLAFTDTALGVAQQALAAEDRSRAAVALRAARDSAAQALALTEGITHRGDELTAAAGQVQAVLSDLEHDLAAARGLPDPEGRFARAISTTERAVAAARSGTGDPVADLASLQAATAEMDGVIAQARGLQVNAERAASSLQSTLIAAQSQLSAAEDYITARRGAVGADARTALAEGGRSFVQARELAAVDPAAALGHAQRAQQLAGQALNLAQRDVGGFQGGGGGGMFGGGTSGGNGGGLGGALLGGIIINSLLGGGNSRGGGYGGGYRGPSGGGRSSGGRGSSGGRSSGGGGRSSGGRGRSGGGRF